MLFPIDVKQLPYHGPGPKNVNRHASPFIVAFAEKFGDIRTAKLEYVLSSNRAQHPQ